MWIFWLWLALFSEAKDEPDVLRDEETALEVVLPSGWTLHPQSGRQGSLLIRMYAEDGTAHRRFVVLDDSPEQTSDLASRVSKLERAMKLELTVSPATVGGLDAEEIVYDVSGMRTVERGVLREGRYQIFQVSASSSDWDDPSLGPALQNVFSSLRFIEGERPAFDPEEFDPKSPAEVRAARAAQTSPDRPFAIRHHDVRLVIDPPEGSLLCVDEFTVEALEDGVDEIALIQTHVDVDAIEVEGNALEFESLAGNQLIVRLAEPLAKGESIGLTYRAHADDYCYSHAQELVAEVEMLGQVRERSSFSSHVVYYPIDADNDASVSIEMDVPQGYVAISGGDRITEELGERVIVRFDTEDRRARILPFGFAVGPYEVFEDSTDGGLAIEFFCPPEHAEFGEQYVEFALRCASFFETLMGPLPWDRVGFAVVEPERREMGVSLPGLVLLSPAYWGDLTDVEIDGAALSSPEMGRFLIVADELAHQWNAYSAPLPNELAEGISTFTNLLVIEREANHQEYVEGVAFCSQVYLDHVSPASDVALADPALYSSDGYRLIAFCKVASVMHDLRRRIGDEAFFGGWRRAFESVTDRRTAYDVFRAAFEEASGADLRAYFDAWFFRAGRPRVQFDWSTREVDGGAEVEVTLTQEGDALPFEFELDVECEHEDGRRERRRLSVRSLVHRETWTLAGSPVEVYLDPDGVALIERRQP